MDINEIRRLNLLKLIEHRFNGKKSAFAKAIGKPESQVYRFFNTGKNGRNLGTTSARDIEGILNIENGSLDSLETHTADMTVETGTKNIGETNVADAVAKHETAPLISNVQAGVWMEGIDEFSPNDAEQWLPKPVGGKNSYYLRVVGDSMTCQVGDSFPEGILILIDPDEQWVNGSFIVAKIVGQNGVTFKQLKYDEHDHPYLKALNPKWGNVFDEFRVLGKMVFSGNFY